MLIDTPAMSTGIGIFSDTAIEQVDCSPAVKYGVSLVN